MTINFVAKAFRVVLFFLFLSSMVSNIALAQGTGENSPLFRQASGIFRVAESDQLADSVNVWGDVSITGRFLIPKKTSIPKLMSYAGGPGGLNSDIFGLSKVRIQVNISRYLGSDNNKSIVKNFKFSYKDPIPQELYQFELQNNDVVSIEVRRRPNFLDYLKVIGPIVSTIVTVIALRQVF